MSKTVQFQIIQFSISAQFKCSYSLIVLGPFQVLPRRARVDLEAKAMKGCSIFPKASASLEPHHLIV